MKLVLEAVMEESLVGSPRAALYLTDEQGERVACLMSLGVNPDYKLAPLDDQFAAGMFADALRTMFSEAGLL